MTRPTPADLESARDRTIPDVLAPGLAVVFSGINPGLWSAATGLHFARPGNRFWPALHRAGFTSRLLDPSEQALLLDLGLGCSRTGSRSSGSAPTARPSAAGPWWWVPRRSGWAPPGRRDPAPLASRLQMSAWAARHLVSHIAAGRRLHVLPIA